MPTATNILDHIVHLTPVGSLKETRKQWEELGFTVIPGGQHADGLTENALVILSDLVYIELITFIHPVEYYTPGTPPYLLRVGNQWANKPPGFVSYAFGGEATATPSIVEIINSRLEEAGSAYRYKGPKKGGRVRPDGVKLAWELTVPSAWENLIDGTGRPFYCADVTPRPLRVPTDEKHQVHDNKTKSVAFIRLLAPQDSFAERSKELQAIVGDAPLVADDGAHEWTLSAPGPGQLPQLILATPKDDAEADFVSKNGLGLYEVGFLVEEGGGRKERTTPFGNITWVSASS